MASYACSKCGRPLKDENSCCGYCWTWHGNGSSRRTKAQSKCKKCGRKVESEGE